MNLELLLAPGNNGTSTLTAKRDGRTIHLDKLDLSQQKERAEFLRKLTQKLPELDAEETDRQLLALAVEQTEPKRSRPRLKRFEPFPVDRLPEPVKGFVVAGAAALGCDTTLIILPLLSVLAAAVGATRRIRLKATWAEPAVIWAAVVSESGTLKSPSQSLALSIVNRLQGFKLQELPELVKQYHLDKAFGKSICRTGKPKAGTRASRCPRNPRNRRLKDTLFPILQSKLWLTV